MKIFRYLIPLILFINLSLSSYSQILIEDAVSMNSITLEEKESINKNGFVVRPKRIYDFDFASKREKKKGISKISKYIECQLKVIHNGVNYQIFVIGDVIRYHYDGSIKTEEMYDSSGFQEKEIEYSDLSQGHFILQKIFYKHLIKNDTSFIKYNYIQYYENGNVKLNTNHIGIYTKNIKNGVWTQRKDLTGSWISYYLNGEIQKKRVCKDIYPMNLFDDNH